MSLCLMAGVILIPGFQPIFPLAIDLAKSADYYLPVTQIFVTANSAYGFILLTLKPGDTITDFYPIVMCSLDLSANQPVVLLSHTKSASVISYQPVSSIILS